MLSEGSIGSPSSKFRKSAFIYSPHKISIYQDFLRGRINFIFRGFYDAVFRIFGENSCDSTLMVLVVEEKCFHKGKDFSAHSALPVSRQDQARVVDPDWPKGYAVPHGIMLSNKSWGKEGGRRGHSKFPKKPLCMMRFCPGNSWTPACWWEVLNKFLILFCLCTELLLY